MNDIHQRIANLSPEKRALFEKRLAESSTAGNRVAPIEHIPAQAVMPSFGQEMLWIIEQIESGTAQYNISYSLYLSGELNVAALENALSALVSRHETLRTKYKMTADGRLRLEFSATDNFPLSFMDFTGAEKNKLDELLSAALGAEANRPIMLDRDLIIRAVLYRLDSCEHVLQLTIHHVAMDAWSKEVLFRDLSALYNAAVTGSPAQLPDLPIAFSDYARWQREQLAGPEGERLIKYWKNQLQGSSYTLQLPTDRPRPEVKTHHGASRLYSVPAALAQAIHDFCHREKVTPFMVVLTAFYAVLSRYTGQSDILIGSQIAARPRIETEELVGFFTNNVILRGRLDGDPSFLELLHRVRQTALEAYAHQNLPLALLIQEIVVERDPSRPALFQVMLVYQNTQLHELEFHGLQSSLRDVRTNTSKFELMLELTPSGDKFDAVIEYNTDLFNSDTIDRLWGHLTAYLQCAIAAPERKAAMIPLLTSPERHQLLVEWNATKREYPRDTPLAALMEAQAERAPDAIAVVYGEQRLTYRALNEHANRLAHRLLRLGVKPREKVGIAIERSPELIAGILATLKAGAAYVPIDPAYPLEHRDFIMRDCGIRFLLIAPRSEPIATECAIEFIDAGKDPGNGSDLDGKNPPAIARQDWPAYVMYTSGSTGRPKGVEITQRGIVRLVVGSEFAELNEKQVFLQLAPISFDASTFEIWGALLHGAQLVLFTGSLPDADEIGTALSQYKVTTLWLTASLFNTIVDTDPGILAPVSQLLVGGEALSAPHVIRALRALPKTKLINGYGPTECTTFSCCYTIPRNIDSASASIPIGRPIANTKTYNLDSNLQPLPIGVVGNLYIGGDGLALGYLNQPELTRESFIPNPFLPRERIYKTGDLVRYLPDGNLEFVGRADQQIKMRGYRIEPGEIETALQEQPEIDQAVVMAREDTPGDKRLVAYLVASSGKALATDEVRKRLQLRLPDFMLPSAYVLLEQLPMSPNGKIDRKALPAPTKTHAAPTYSFSAPRNLIEEKLAGIWAEVLGVQEVGIRDDFFELGGHSLKAVRLIAKIRAAFPQSQPSLAVLLKAPTVEQFAETLRVGQAEWSYLVPLREGSGRPPFFCVHGAGGNVLDMRELAMAMPADQPFYCLQARGLDGHSAPFSSIEEAAECYVEQIRRVQSHGPYFLGGRSYGGIVAFEMAQRLRMAGEVVSVVALIDTYNYAYGSFLSRTALLYYNSKYFLRRVIHHIRILGRMKPRTWSHYLAGRARIFLHLAGNVARIARGGKGTLFPTKGLGNELQIHAGHRELEEILSRVQAASIAAIRDYIPKPYDGPLLLFRASVQNEKNPYNDETLGWHPVALGGVTVCVVDGDHQSILYNPAVAEIAKKLDEAIRGAQMPAQRDDQRQEAALAALEQ